MASSNSGGRAAAGKRWAGRHVGRRAGLLPGAWLSAAAWPDTRGPCAPGRRLNLPAQHPGLGHWLLAPHFPITLLLTGGDIIYNKTMI